MEKRLIFEDGRRLFLTRMVSLQKGTEIVASGTTTTAGAQIIFWHPNNSKWYLVWPVRVPNTLAAKK